MRNSQVPVVHKNKSKLSTYNVPSKEKRIGKSRGHETRIDERNKKARRGDYERREEKE